MSSPDDMQQRPDLTALPSVIERLIQPWIEAIETTSTGMGSIVETAAQDASGSLKRRVDLTPAAEDALAQALGASEELARKLAGKAPATSEREAVLVSLNALALALRDAQPSDSTRALGLGW